MDIFIIRKCNLCKILGFLGGDYEECRLMGCVAPPSSG
jgi:hypothetical protein